MMAVKLRRLPVVLGGIGRRSAQYSLPALWRHRLVQGGRRALVGSLCLFGPEAAIAAASTPTLSSETKMVVLVDDQEKIGEDLVQEAEKLGGYFSELSQNQLVVKVPQIKRDAFISAASTAGKVVSRQLEARDLSTTQARLIGSLASREEMLTRYLANIGQTSKHEDLTVLQVATGKLIEEIEDFKGKLRLLEHQAKYATIDVSFQIRDRRAISVQRPSSFAWLSTVDLNQIMADFSRPGEGL